MKGGAAMAALTSVSITTAGGTPAPVAVSASDTIAASQFGSTGVILRVINAGGSPDSVAVTDPNLSIMGNSVTVPTPVSVPATTGIRMIYVPLSAVNQTTQLATVTHTFTTTVTIEVYRT
jgi:hypothetical protein